MEMKGKTAIITGSSGKLGSAVAIQLAGQGCNCICHYNSNLVSARQTAESIECLGCKAVLIQADLSSEKQIQRLFTVDELSLPQILVNSASYFYRQPLTDVDFDSSRKILNLNTITPILISKLFADHLNYSEKNENGIKGKIINMTDVAAGHPWSEYSVYCASKAGLWAATVSLAKELAPDITVNAVAPGLVSFPEGFKEEDVKIKAQSVPMKRAAHYEEVTSAITFLLKNDYITGRTITVDGGRYI